MKTGRRISTPRRQADARSSGQTTTLRRHCRVLLPCHRLFRRRSSAPRGTLGPPPTSPNGGRRPTSRGASRMPTRYSVGRLAGLGKLIRIPPVYGALRSIAKQVVQQLAQRHSESSSTTCHVQASRAADHQRRPAVGERGTIRSRRTPPPPEELAPNVLRPAG
jgi:hypothetical protein